MANIDGTANDDILDGTNNDDTINGFAGNDRINGNDGNDVINGGDGSDQINGGAGNDTINPGDNTGGTLERNGFEGFDFTIGSIGDDEYIFTDSIIGYQGLSYRSAGLSGGITVTIDGTANTGTVNKGADGTDTLTDIEVVLDAGGNPAGVGGLSVRGTDMNDTFNITNDAMGTPNGQWMAVYGYDGVDSYNITSGVVRLDFRGGSQSINVDLSTGTVNNDGFGNMETITGDVWELRGGSADDTFVGSSNDESFIGEEGNDNIDGGGGFDRLRFDRNGVDRVILDLSAGFALGVWDDEVFNYTISNIEWVRGSLQGSDTLIGDAQNNKLVGFGGADLLEGGEGDDELYGEHDESGATIVNGQSDAFVFRGNFGNDTIMDFAANDVIRFDQAVHGTPIVAAQGADVLISFTGLAETVLVKNASVADVNASIEFITSNLSTTGDGAIPINGTISAGTTGVADGTADGTATISAASYDGVNAFEQLAAGDVTDGIVNINQGAIVFVDAAVNNNFPFAPGGIPSGTYGYIYQAVRAGTGVGSTGIINVDGPGTRLNVEGAPGGVRIGREGTGTLNITNGATVETFFLDAAREGTATATINVDGSGTSLLMNNFGGSFPQAAYSGSGAFGRIGRESGSKGYLNITNGARFEMANEDGVTDNPAFQIARNDGSYGKATVDGAGSQWNITQVGSNGDSYTPFTNLTVGRNGQGILEISDSGVVNVTGDRAAVAVSGAFSGDSVVDPASRLEITTGGILNVESNTGGTPDPNNPGSYLPGPRFQTGIGTNANATTIIDGAGSAININGNYGYSAIGREGTASLTVRNGGSFNMDGGGASLVVGHGDGMGAQVNQSHITVETGGTVNITSSNTGNGASINLGRNSDGNGFMSIDGAGSQVNISSENNGYVASVAAFINIGREGMGELRISNGGEMNIMGGVNDDFPGMNVGRNATGNGIVVVEDAGSAINISGLNTAIGGGGGFVSVGRYGTGYLTALNGGIVQNDVSDGTLLVGIEIGANGTVRADGAGSLIDGGVLGIIGADFNFSANDITAIDFINTGTGVARAVDGGTIRADNFFVGNGGTLEGNGTFDGNVIMGGDDSGASVATLFPGTAADPGATLNITGNLTMTYGTMNLEIFSTTPADNDIINVGGIADLDGGSIAITFRNGFNFSAGDTVTIVSATDLDYDSDGVGVDPFNAIADQALFIADTGSDLIISALNNGGGEVGIMDFGAASATGVQAMIENKEGVATGGAFDSSGFTQIDQFLGTDMSDTFDGTASTIGLDIQSRDGDDRLLGGTGNDVFDGGAGTDTAVFQGVASNFTFAFNGSGDLIVTDTVGSEGMDTLTDFELLEFNGVTFQLTQGDDTANTLAGNTLADLMLGFGDNDSINASSGDDIIIAGDGDDDLVGGAGADVLDGGANSALGAQGAKGVGDTASYSNSNAAVNVDLDAGNASGGHADGDTLNDIENLQGSIFADMLTGDSNNNFIDGFNGDDTLMGGLGNDNLNGGQGNDTLIGDEGSDFLNGGTGNSDTADYSNSNAAVTVQLNIGGTIDGGFATGDTVWTENIIGSAFADDINGNTLGNILTGNDGDDTFNGSSGSDTINGGAGDDFLLGSRGADTIDGGTNTGVGDTASYSNSDARIVVDLIAGTATGSGHGSGDTLIDIENIFGSLFNDDIFGDDNDNVLEGFSGVDELFGRGGNDTLIGGGGFDFLNGGEGDDTLSGSGGDDRFLFDIANFGADTITDFTNNRDRMDMRGSGLQFSDLTVTVGATDTVVTVTADPTNSITLQGITTLIDANDFIF